MNKVIIIEHDGHRFITSEGQIQDKDSEYLGFYIAALCGKILPIKRKSIYGDILLDHYITGDYSRV